MGGMVQNLLYANHAGSLPHLSVHFLPLYAVVFQGKGNIFGHRQADELAVGILQDGAHNLAQAKQTQCLGVLSRHRQLAGGLALIRGGDQTVDAVGQGGLSAAGRAGDEHLFTLADLQIDVVQGRLRLGGILKAEIFKGNDNVLIQKDFPPKSKGRRKRLPFCADELIPCPASGCRPWAWQQHKPGTAECRRWRW